MTYEQTIGLVLALIVMMIGVVGCVLPVLPGIPLVLLSAFAHKLYFGNAGAAWWVLIVMTVVGALATGLDYAASVYGARKLGATWRGGLGAVGGALVGLLFAPIGLLVGPFIGAVLFELAGHRPWKDASKAGAGAVLGLLAGGIGKLTCALCMVALFTFNVIYRCNVEAQQTKPSQSDTNILQNSIPQPTNRNQQTQQLGPFHTVRTTWPAWEKGPHGPTRLGPVTDSARPSCRARPACRARLQRQLQQGQNRLNCCCGRTRPAVQVHAPAQAVYGSSCAVS